MFRALFENTPDAMIVVDQTGVMLRANPQAARLFGFPIERMEGQPIEMLMPESVRGAHHGHLQRYTHNPRVRPMGAGQELIGRRADGDTFPVEIALSPIDNEGVPVYLACIRDVSETQRARQALVRARFDAFLAQAGQVALESPNVETAMASLCGLVATALSLDGVAIVLAQAHRRELQVLAGSAIPASILPRSLDREGALAQLLENGQSRLLGPDDADDELLRSSGCASAALVPLFDLKRPMGTVVALARESRDFDHDTVHFLQTVANLMAASVQRGRTAEQLAHAQRLDALGQLTGGIAHDFNNLLTVISGNLQLLEAETSAPSPSHDMIDSALRAVGRGAELTRKLLAFARRQRLTPRAVEPHRLLDDIGALLTRTLGERVILNIQCPADLPDVYADASELDAALINLALNARDAMPRGGRLSISVRTETVESSQGDLKPGQFVVFSVADTGIGMTPEVLARAFEPFFTTKETGKGSGLGLSMVYGFATQSGGALRIDSQLGYGTRIDLCLPAAHTDAPTTVVLPRLRSSTGNETILVVEDEPEVRGIAVAFLRSLGYGVAVAADAQEALDLLQQRTDIVLMFSDVVLGTGLTGHELVEEARRLRPNLPTLLTSGYEPASADSEAMSDAPELLRKPYRREDLAAAIRRTLDH